MPSLAQLRDLDSRAWSTATGRQHRREDAERETVATFPRKIRNSFTLGAAR
jgi:hypothetical protein